MIEIDGSKYEGGGQIIRTALALSTVTGKAFRAMHIRKGRTKPGLKAQHLHGIKALESLFNSKSEYARLGSEELVFYPGVQHQKSVEIDIGTAGSISLILQSLVIPCLFQKNQTKLAIKGGTDVQWSPQMDYCKSVFLPHLNKYTEKLELTIKKRGYYPKGNGEVELLIKPKGTFEERQQANKIQLINQGSLMQIRGVSHASEDLSRAQVAERQADAAKHALNPLHCPVSIQTSYQNTDSTGSGIALWAVFSKDGTQTDEQDPIIIGNDILGKKGKSALDVGKEAAVGLKEGIESKKPADPMLADQLIPFIALFGGEIHTSSITDHCRANAYVCKKFLGNVIEIDEEKAVIRSIL